MDRLTVQLADEQTDQNRQSRAKMQTLQLIYEEVQKVIYAMKSEMFSN